MKISFVIPIYKVEEKLLSKLIDSLNTQKHHYMFECIFVIDEINYSTNYEKIISNLENTIQYKIIQNKLNQGSGESRNIGIKNSTGEYVAFIDSDDYISSDYLDKIENFFTSHESDLIRINYTKNKRDEPISAITNYKYFGDSIIPGWAPYTMIIKMDFLKKHNIWFPKGFSYAEDIYLFILIMCNLEWWYDINIQTYHYNRKTENSITSYMHKNYIKAYIVIRKIIKLAKKEIKTKEQFKKLKFFKGYIFKRSFKNVLFIIFRLDRTNI